MAWLSPLMALLGTACIVVGLVALLGGVLTGGRLKRTVTPAEMSIVFGAGIVLLVFAKVFE